MKEPWCLAAAATRKLVCRARDQEGDAGPCHLRAHVMIEEEVAEKVLNQARTALRKEAALAIPRTTSAIRFKRRCSWRDPSCPGIWPSLHSSGGDDVSSTARARTAGRVPTTALVRTRRVRDLQL
jgi:hypothetical protein